MDIEKALKYTFEDERWVTKGLIGVVMMLLSFLIIPAFFVEGYLVQIVRNVMDGDEFPLPEWEDWGKLFMDGLNVFIATLVYTLPFWLLLCCSLVFFIPAGATEGDVSELLAGLGAVAVAVVSCLGILFMIAVALLGPAIVIQYAHDGTLSSTLQFREVIDMTRDNIGNIIIALAVIFGISLVLGIVGAIPIVGWIVALAAGIYTTFVSGHLFGQIGIDIFGAGKEKELDLDLSG